jgi:uncharacterized membrane protein YgcG
MNTVQLVLSSILLLASAVPQTPPAQPAAQQPAAAKPAEPKPDAQKTEPAKPGSTKPAAAAATFTAEQLEQIVAPIALHPDTLLTQILMSSTYPLEIVQAYRWSQKNPSLKGTALDEALKKQDWDPSVKALCSLPTVLKQMNDNLDWTQDLGDAFLGQQEELMQTVQKMRKKALEAGNLKSGEQQKVSQTGDVIVIESTKTEVVYVPTYYPTAVYGPSWSYPYYYYPPMYPAYPAGGMLFAFSVGVAWGGGWGNCNWGGNNVYINHNEFNNFNKNTNINGGRDNLPGGGKGDWKHNPEHRKGANYKNPQTAQKYGGSAGSNRVSKDQARGYDRSGSKAKPAAGGGAAQRPSAGSSSRPSAGNTKAPSGARPSSGASTRSTPKASSGALSGSGSAGGARASSARGASSRGGGRGGGGGRRR